MANNITPIDGGVVDDRPAVFKVANKIFEGFLNIMLSRNLTSLTGTFTITLTDKWAVDQEDFILKPGQKISCMVGKSPLYSGYIDSLSISLSDSSRNLTITGRDKTGDLVDCSIIGSNEFNNMKLEQIAKKICSPFDIGIIVFADTGKNFSKFTTHQGETVFEALERLAKQRNLLLTSSPVGNLVFEKKGSVRASTELIEGVNILSAVARYDNSERYSEYHVKGQSTGLVGDSKDATSGKGIAKDLGVLRYRPLLLLSENASNTDDCKKRAQWEANIRAGKATEVSITVVGWFQKDGELWATNQMVSIDCKSIGLKQDMLISSVGFNQSAKGRKTQLQLIRPDAFEFKEVVKKEKDPLDSLGL